MKKMNSLGTYQFNNKNRYSPCDGGGSAAPKWQNANSK